MIRYDAVQNKFNDVVISTTYKSIFALFISDAHTLWFATGGNVVCRIDLKSSKQTQFSVTATLGFPSVTWMNVDAKGNVIVSSTSEQRKNIVSINPLSGVVSMIEDPVTRSRADTLTSLRPLFTERSGRSWYALRKYSKKQNTTSYAFELLIAPAGEKTEPSHIACREEPRAFLEDAKSLGVYWVGTIQGLTKIVESQRRVMTIRHDEKNSASLNDNYVRAFARDNNGQIWIGTTSGMNILHG